MDRATVETSTNYFQGSQVTADIGDTAMKTKKMFTTGRKL